jgi:hypothetical protein
MLPGPYLAPRAWSALAQQSFCDDCGLLIDFNVPVLKDGLTRVLNTKT